MDPEAKSVQRLAKRLLVLLISSAGLFVIAFGMSIRTCTCPREEKVHVARTKLAQLIGDIDVFWTLEYPNWTCREALTEWQAIRDPPRDPWGIPYVFGCEPDALGDAAPYAFSTGPDGLARTADDIFPSAGSTSYTPTPHHEPRVSRLLGTVVTGVVSKLPIVRLLDFVRSLKRI